VVDPKTGRLVDVNNIDGFVHAFLEIFSRKNYSDPREFVKCGKNIESMMIQYQELVSCIYGRKVC
jgi:ribosomal protein S1